MLHSKSVDSAKSGMLVNSAQVTALLKGVQVSHPFLLACSNKVARTAGSPGRAQRMPRSVVLEPRALCSALIFAWL